jgi:hypothetical protein
MLGIFEVILTENKNGIFFSKKQIQSVGVAATSWRQLTNVQQQQIDFQLQIFFCCIKV